MTDRITSIPFQNDTQTSGAKKNILILGGSYARISTAHYLLKHVLPQLPNRPSYQVIIASTFSQAICRPACPRALISGDVFPEEKLFINIPQLFEQYPKDSFRFIHRTATELDHVSRTVSISLAVDDTSEKLPFQTLVIATGASTPSPLHRLNQSSSSSLRAHWNIFRTALPTVKSILIAGGGPAGIETAGELGEYLHGRAGWFIPKLPNPKVAVTDVASGLSFTCATPRAVKESGGVSRQSRRRGRQESTRQDRHTTQRRHRKRAHSTSNADSRRRQNTERRSLCPRDRHLPQHELHPLILPYSTRWTRRHQRLYLACR